jgi:hypothetical protein
MANQGGQRLSQGKLRPEWQAFCQTPSQQESCWFAGRKIRKQRLDLLDQFSRLPLQERQFKKGISMFRAL